MTETAAYIRASINDLYPPEEVRALVRLIMERICGLSTYQLLLGKDKDLSDTERAKIEKIIQGLRAYEPIQYLLGIADFYGMDLKVTPAVLIPRPETAELVGHILHDYQGQAPRVIDIGTGSGCIAIALAKHLPGARVTALDISAEALAIARENARDNQAEVTFLQGDILSEDIDNALNHKACFSSKENIVSFEGKHSFIRRNTLFHSNETFDCVVSNPPYIMEKEKTGMEANVLEYEPRLALFVPDENPLLFYRAIARFARRHLAPGGRLYFEINALCGEATRSLLKETGFTRVELIQDLYEKDRFIKASL